MSEEVMSSLSAKTQNQLIDEIARLTAERDAALAGKAEAERTLGGLLEVRQNLHLEIMLEWRGIENGCECRACGGAGVRAYASTATWRGGVGGQAFTSDVCDECWGSGDRNNAWPSRKGAISRADEAERLAVWAVRKGVLISVDNTMTWMLDDEKDEDEYRIGRADCDGTDADILRALREAAAMGGGSNA